VYGSEVAELVYSLQSSRPTQLSIPQSWERCRKPRVSRIPPTIAKRIEYCSPFDVEGAFISIVRRRGDESIPITAQTINSSE
jgi:hypothetical protein